jgi:hypothetical protein
MNKRLFSICTPCPEGFTFCPEFQAREFRRSPFALYAPSLDIAREFLGDRLTSPRLFPWLLSPLRCFRTLPILRLISWPS